MDETAPLNYFTQAFGPAAIPTMHLGWAFAALSGTVCIVITVLLLLAILRKRQEGNTSAIVEDAGVVWVYIGTGISTAILFGFTIYMLLVLDEVAKPPQASALTVTVTGYDWWWNADYENNDPARRFSTANEIHIPVGQPVLVELKSADVIHAFWVPELAGKTQMIPGLMNRQWIQADKPGIYHGQCTQYCGVQHAHMMFDVVAQDQVDFKRWETEQAAPAPATPSSARAGRNLFMNRCGSCHAVRGTEATGAHAPDLTHLGSRRMIAAGLMTNTPEHLVEWTMHAQELKPGVRMPSIALSFSEQADLSSFLATLH